MVSRFFGFSIGPFVFGNVHRDVPASSRAKLLAWLGTVALILSASLPLGLLLAVPTAIYLIVTFISKHIDLEDQP